MTGGEETDTGDGAGAGGGAGEAAIRAALSNARTVKVAVGADGPVNVDRVLAAKERNDIGNAERLIARHGGEILFVRDVGWHAWSGRHWSPVGAADAVKRKAHATVRDIMAEVQALQAGGCPVGWARPDFEKWQEDLFKWAMASGNRSRIDAMVVEAQPYLTVGPDAMDADPFVLNLENGTLVLDGACQDLRPHDPSDNLAKVMDVAFDPNAACPEFDRFMATVQPDVEVRKFLQVWAGYCLTGSIKEQKLAFNYGEGGNGKSVFVDLMTRMMGPYAVPLPFSSLVRDDRKRGADATPDLARLPGARFVPASEPEKGTHFAEATIKQVTGNEKVTVRHLREGFFDFMPEFKIMLSGNHKPVIRGQDRGIWRRFLLVPWEVNIPEAEQDRNLPAKLWAERSGVLNWLLDGTRTWLEKGLVVPRRVSAATEAYRNDSDPLGRFLAACVRPAKGQNVQASALYGAYEKWAAANSENTWTLTGFGRAMGDRPDYRKDEIGGRKFYLDIELVNVPEKTDGPPPVRSEDDYG